MAQRGLSSATEANNVVRIPGFPIQAEREYPRERPLPPTTTTIKNGIGYSSIKISHSDSLRAGIVS